MQYHRNFSFHRLLPVLLVVATGLILWSCTSEEAVPMDLSEESIIPRPVSITPTGSSFELTEETDVYVQGTDEDALRVGNYLADLLNPSTGLEINLQVAEGTPAPGNIYLTLGGDQGPEGYQLEITEDLTTITASDAAGLFYGVQTLRQLLPASVEKGSQQPGPWRVATGTITDQPDYGYRGSMLDVSRHFFGVEDVKRYIDLISMYKMNHLHLHLSDDQGWRIEIKSWPNLTAHGGSTEVGGGEGGFYTQEEYADLVEYAQDRFVTIVPEIDMPGHTNAALASYPELNCSGEAPELYTGTEVGFSTLCTDKEITYQFVDDVVREISALTPGPYFHIGGDESHVTPLEDYIPFINRVQEIVRSHGKQVIGWDEIAHAGLSPNTVVQWWADAENARMAIEQGAKVLMSPATKTYLDMQYDSTTELGLHWAAYIEVDSAYQWEPVSMTEGIGKEDIIGVEAPLWTETITNMDEIEYMIFPRLPGIAEIGWTSEELRDWDDYRVRLGHHQARFEALGIDYYKSDLVPWEGEETSTESTELKD